MSDTVAQPIVVVAGVSGVGKSTVGRLLAQRLGVAFAEGDDFHPPANIAAMSRGVPLDDHGRGPWLDAVAGWLHDHAGTGGVITCSALKRRYRDRLRGGATATFFVQLVGSPQVLAARLGERAGHFMPAALLASQLADHEPLGPDEPGLAVDAEPPPAQIVDIVVRALAR